MSLRWKPDGTLVEFFVYIMSNNSMTLYTGMTNDLGRRVAEHKRQGGDTFTHWYHCTRLVYFERFHDPVAAIKREKVIKGWKRARKIALVKTMNPQWLDLSDAWHTQARANH